MYKHDKRPDLSIFTSVNQHAKTVLEQIRNATHIGNASHHRLSEYVRTHFDFYTLIAVLD